MSLSCDCGYGDYDYYYRPDNDLTPLESTRRKRCLSCSSVIDHGEECLKFHNWRPTKTDIEESIHGDEVQLANTYMCEECAGLYWALEERGFCIGLGEESMKDMVKEYHDLYG